MTKAPFDRKGFSDSFSVADAQDRQNEGLVNYVNSWSPSKVPTRYPDTSRLHTSFRRYRFWEKLFFVAGPADKIPFPQDANVNAQETLGVEGTLYTLDP